MSGRFWPFCDGRQDANRGAASSRIPAVRKIWGNITAGDPMQIFAANEVTCSGRANDRWVEVLSRIGRHHFGGRWCRHIFWTKAQQSCWGASSKDQFSSP